MGRLLTGGRPAFVIPVVVVVAGALLAFFHNRYWYPPDEGNYAHVAERVLEGDVLHHDVQDVHTGAVNYVNALALSAFGPRLVSLRYPVVIASLLQAILVAALLLEQGSIVAVVGGVASVALGFVQFPNPSANWYALFLTICLVAWLRWAPAGRRRVLVAGFILGLICAFRQLTGAIVGIGLLTWLLVEVPAGSDDHEAGQEGAGWFARVVWLGGLVALVVYIARATGVTGWILFGAWAPIIHLIAGRELRASSRTAIGIVLLLATGVLAVFVPILVPQVVAGGLGPWWRDVVGAAGTLLGVTAHPLQRWSTWLFAFSLGGFVVGLPGPVLGAALTVALIATACLGIEMLARRRTVTSFRSLGPTPFLALYYGLVAVHFPSPAYLYFALPMVVLGWLALRRSRAPVWVLALAIPVLVYWFAAQPADRSLQQMMRGERIPWVCVPGLDRSGLLVSPGSAEAWGRLIGRLRDETEPEDAVFAFPSHAEVYFLADRRNPTRFFNTALGLRNDADLSGLLRGFSDDPPAAILFDRSRHYATSQSDSLHAWVVTRYAPADSANGMILYLPDRRLE